MAKPIEETNELLKKKASKTKIIQSTNNMAKKYYDKIMGVKTKNLITEPAQKIPRINSMLKYSEEEWGKEERDKMTMR